MAGTPVNPSGQGRRAGPAAGSPWSGPEHTGRRPPCRAGPPPRSAPPCRRRPRTSGWAGPVRAVRRGAPPAPGCAVHRACRPQPPVRVPRRRTTSGSGALSRARSMSGGRVPALAGAGAHLGPALLGDAKEAEDLTQQVFLGVWRARRGYWPEHGPLAGWITGITRHRTADARAARIRRCEPVASEGFRPALADLAGDRFDGALDRVVVRAELAKLASARQRVLRLAFNRTVAGVRSRAPGPAAGHRQEPQTARAAQAEARTRSRLRFASDVTIAPPTLTPPTPARSSRAVERSSRRGCGRSVPARRFCPLRPRRRPCRSRR